jgi:hypothetical protein
VKCSATLTNLKGLTDAIPADQYTLPSRQQSYKLKLQYKSRDSYAGAVLAVFCK